jgi:hypothetical protein
MAASALGGHYGPAGVGVYALYVAQFLFLLRRFGSFWIVTAILYPIPLLFFFVTFAWSIARPRRKVMWKGRAIGAD